MCGALIDVNIKSKKKDCLIILSMLLTWDFVMISWEGEKSIYVSFCFKHHDWLLICAYFIVTMVCLFSLPSFQVWDKIQWRPKIFYQSYTLGWIEFY